MTRQTSRVIEINFALELSEHLSDNEVNEIMIILTSNLDEMRRRLAGTGRVKFGATRCAAQPTSDSIAADVVRRIVEEPED